MIISSNNDLYFMVGEWAYALASLIALSIGFLAFRGYLLFRNWRFLALSLAFIMLAIAPLTQLIFLIWSVSISTPLEDMISFAPTCLALLLLAIIYVDERKKASIKITRTQWVITGAIILVELVFCIIELSALLSIGNALSSTVIWSSIADYFALAIIYILSTLTITSLYAYYRSKKSNITLLTAVGFTCITFRYIAYIIVYIPVTTTSFFHLPIDVIAEMEGITLFWTAQSMIFLIGYLLFLAAIVRVRVSNG